MLDAAGARGADALEPGEPIFVDDLERAEESAGVRASDGDAARAHWTLAPPREARRLEGVRASRRTRCVLPAVAARTRRRVALGCDGVSDVLLSRIDGVALPVHSVALVAMDCT